MVQVTVHLHELQQTALIFFYFQYNNQAEGQKIFVNTTKIMNLTVNYISSYKICDHKLDVHVK